MLYAEYNTALDTFTIAESGDYYIDTEFDVYSHHYLSGRGFIDELVYDEKILKRIFKAIATDLSEQTSTSLRFIQSVIKNLSHSDAHKILKPLSLRVITWKSLVKELLNPNGVQLNKSDIQIILDSTVSYAMVKGELWCIKE